MPNRIIRESILTSDAIMSLGWAAEVFYRRLLSIVDDHGRFDGRIPVIRGRLYLLQLSQVSESDVESWLVKCQSAGLVRLYEVDKKKYVEVAKFGQQKRSASKWPEPPCVADDINCAANDITCAAEAKQMKSVAHLGVVEGVVEGAGEGEGVFVCDEKNQNGESLPTPKPPPKPVPKEQRQRNAMKDAIAAACYPGVEPVRSDWGRIQKATTDMLDDDVPVEEVPRLAEAWREAWPDMTLTPQGLAKHVTTMRQHIANGDKTDPDASGYWDDAIDEYVKKNGGTV